jgi:hypothetical protein
MEGMEMRITVLREALQLQLERQVVKLERISSRIGVRVSSFGVWGVAWMGISVANEVGRTRLVEEDYSKPSGLTRCHS